MESTTPVFQRPSSDGELPRIVRVAEAETDAVEMLKPDWDVLNKWVAKVPEELLTDCARSVGDAFEKFNQFLALEEWVFDREIRANTANTLFLEGSFASHVVHKLLFDDLGMKYLSNLTKSIIAKILTYTGTTSQEEEEKLKEWTLEFLDQFDNAVLCPVFLRESFLLMETKVNNRFSSHFSSNPFMIQYMFSSYICPVLRNPLRSLLPDDMEEVPSTSEKILETFSYFLNNLALNAFSSYEGSLSEFIQSKHPVLVASFSKLIDKESLEKAKVIVSWSTEDRKLTELEKEQSLENLKDVLSAIANWNSQAQESRRRARDIAELPNLLPTLEEKLNDASWKKTEVTRHTTFSKGLKSKQGAIRGTKGEAKVPGNIERAVEFVFTHLFDKEYFSNLSKCEVVEELDQEMNGKKVQYREVYIVIKGAFPFTPRDMCLQIWKFFETAEKAYIVINSLEKPLKKNYIRAVRYVSGWIFQTAGEETNVISIWHGGSKGANPKWAEDKLLLMQARNTDKLINALFNEKSD